MARAQRTPIPRQHPFYARLKALGCTFCCECWAYMWPEHVMHRRLVADLHSPDPSNPALAFGGRLRPMIDQDTTPVLAETAVVGA